jgi:hypothetical protein
VVEHEVFIQVLPVAAAVGSAVAAAVGSAVTAAVGSAVVAAGFVNAQAAQQ